MDSNAYGVASCDIVSESFDGEVVVLDLQSGRYFSFTEAGSCLWEAVTAGLQPKSMVAANAELDTAALDAFVGKLLQFGLIAVQQPGLEVVASPDLFAKIAGTTGAPDVFVFDDLADLFTADPIHDVEEPVGWPAVKAS